MKLLRNPAQVNPQYQKHPKNHKRPEQNPLRSFRYPEIDGKYPETIKRMRDDQYYQDKDRGRA